MRIRGAGLDLGAGVGTCLGTSLALGTDLGLGLDTDLGQGEGCAHARSMAVVHLARLVRAISISKKYFEEEVPNRAT